MVLRRILYGLLICLVATTILGFALGQPLLLSYVESGSMEPTIEEGDGFVVIPSAIAGPPESGDIVMFHAEQVDDGGLTTHRVVGETEEGYVTRGDANVVTDQDGGEPPVGEDRIVAHAVTVGDEPVVVPHLGTVVAASGALLGALPFGNSAVPLLFVGLVIMALGYRYGRGRTPAAQRERSYRRPDCYSVRTVLTVAVTLFVLAATLAMVLPSGSVDYTVVATETPNPDDSMVVEPGDTAVTTHEVDNAGVVPMLVVREPAADDVAIDDGAILLGPVASDEVTVRVETPAEAGSVERTVEEYRYVPVLPPSLIVALHAVHPWLALAAMNGVVALLVALAGIAAPLDRLRVRSTPGFARRLERRFGRERLSGIDERTLRTARRRDRDR